VSKPLGEIIKEIGGVRPYKKSTFGRTILYAQGIAKKNGATLDQVAEYIQNNYPEFGINDEDELLEIIKGENREILYQTQEQVAEKHWYSGLEKMFGIRMFDEPDKDDDVPF
jgi:hypothetical protein